MSVLGKRKEFSALDLLAEACEGELVAAAAGAADVNAVTVLMDALNVDLVFDRIVQFLFCFTNGIQSFVNLALVCHATFQRALYAGRAQRVLRQVYPYLPPIFKNPEDWSLQPWQLSESDPITEPHPIRQLTDKQAFSLIRFLSNAPAQNKDVPQLIYNSLLYESLGASSLSMRYAGTIQSRYYYFDPRDYAPEHSINDLPCERTFACTVRSHRIEIHVTWYDEAENRAHNRLVVVHVGAGAYTVEITGDVEANTIQILVHKDAQPYQLQQISINCLRVSGCGAGKVCGRTDQGYHWSACGCREVPVEPDMRGGVLDVNGQACGVSTHWYDFSALALTAEPLDAKNKRARTKVIQRLSGISQYMATFSVTPTAIAFINMRTLVFTVAEYNGAPLMPMPDSWDAHGPDWLCRSSICATTSATRVRRQAAIIMPFFNYTAAAN